MEKNLQELLERIPVLAEAPWGKDVRAYAEARIDMIYPLTKKIGDPQAGFIFGRNEQIIYFSRYGKTLEGSKKVVSPNVACPNLDIKYIEDIRLRELF